MGIGILRMVVGFAFTPDMKNVVLIEKRRVDPRFSWMLGMLNGLGGKIKDGEFQRETMEREFLEESGVCIPAGQWEVCGSFHCRDEWEVVVFRALTMDVLNVSSTSPDEGEVKLIPVSMLPSLPTVRALEWIIPLITYKDLSVFTVSER